MIKRIHKMEQKLCVLLLLRMTFAVNVSEDIIFQFENGEILHGNVSNVIEGTGLLLRCAHKTIETWTPTWLKEGEPDFRVVSDTLHIDSFRVKHQGTYTCAFAPSEGEFTRNSVEINCLYPPERPTIYGPREVIFREDLILTCNTSAFPQASVWWTFGEETPIVATGSELTFAVQEEGIWEKNFKCWTENTMTPTIGNPVLARLAAHKRISVHYPAYIWELLDLYTFHVGQTLDILCKVGGLPEAEVYWTKDSDKTFSYYGPRLFKKNVQKSFAGYYTCHARNELVNGVKKSDMRSTRVSIEDPSIPSACQEFCDSGTFNVTDCASTTTTTTTTSKVTLSSEKSPCDSSCGIVFIVIAMIGWLVAAIIVIVCLFCWIKHRKKTPKVTKQPRRRPCTQEIDTGERVLRRSLPSLPYNVLERDENSLESHYKQPEGGGRTEETSIKIPYDDDYLTPGGRKEETSTKIPYAGDYFTPGGRKEETSTKIPYAGDYLTPEGRTEETSTKIPYADDYLTPEEGTEETSTKMPCYDNYIKPEGRTEQKKLALRFLMQKNI